MEIKFDPTRVPLQPGEESVKIAATPAGAVVVSGGFVAAAPITPGTPLATPCASITSDADTTITAKFVGAPATTVTLHLLAGQRYDYALTEVVTSTAGNLVALYQATPS